ncbi:MAG: zinc-dependent peptidase [Thermoguttaceae bacterium]|jgi:Mlc titration factor MtfA (ptsG expression regulator)/Tfp pilus assembly protein PilF
MVFSWIKNQRRRQLLSEPFPSGWRTYLRDNVRHYEHLDSRRRMAVEQVVRVFVAEKNWVGGAGIDVTDEMKVTVAGQAAILVLGLEEPYYFDDVRSLILYRGPYLHPARRHDHSRIVRKNAPVYGEAWYRGPIVLSWRIVLESGRNASGGHNLVIHEFAHYLDALDGEVDGDPPLAGHEQRRNWYRVTEAEYLRLLGQARRNEVSLLDHYGASNRAEFFAVASECFFEQPQAMRREHAELYAVLRAFFRQDPAQWLPDAIVSGDGAGSTASRRKRTSAENHRKARLAALRSGNADALFTLAVEYFNEERYWLAAAAATRAIRLNPRDGEAYQQRALARVKLGRYRKALADCKRALRRDPDDWTTYRVRGAACLGLGKYHRAKRDLDRVLTENKLDAEALYLHGRVWTALGEPRQAVADFAKSLAIRPFVAEVYYHSGLANRALGDLEDAEADLANAFRLDPLVDRRK